jgi:hypothetical protein
MGPSELVHKSKPGKSQIDDKVLAEGVTPVGVIVNQAKSTVFWQNLTFLTFTTTPLFAQSVR